MCAHAVRVAIGKIDGVRDVKVTLNEGLATIQFAPTNRVSTEQVRKAIRSNGFMPRGAEVRVAGTLVARADTLLLSVKESGDSFVLQDASDAPGNVAALQKLKFTERVLLDGNLPEFRKGARRDSRPVLVVRSFRAD